jgi:hypothetical protein
VDNAPTTTRRRRWVKPNRYCRACHLLMVHPQQGRLAIADVDGAGSAPRFTIVGIVPVLVVYCPRCNHATVWAVRGAELMHIEQAQCIADEHNKAKLERGGIHYEPLTHIRSELPVLAEYRRG